MKLFEIEISWLEKTIGGGCNKFYTEAPMSLQNKADVKIGSVILRCIVECRLDSFYKSNVHYIHLLE